MAQIHVDFETAAEHSSRDIPIFTPHSRADEMRLSLIGRSFESASHIVVCDHQRFLGVIRIEDLLAASGEQPASALMDVDAPRVAPGLDQEVAAWRAAHHGESALAVVDAEGHFVGMIPPPKLLEVLLSEHEEDLSRMGGYLKQAKAARGASEESVAKRLHHRLPWLLVGLIGAMLSADGVAWFEQQLEAKLMLAFFIPSIVYLADAVGTQTETVFIRALSLGIPMRRMFLREVVSGPVIGAALGAMAYAFVNWRWQDTEVALVVGLAIMSACTIATLIAMVLPWLLDKLDLDPAFGSGPLATVIQDLLSIVIYFLIVMMVM